MTIPQGYKKELQPTTCKERQLCGGINLGKLKTLMRGRSRGGISKDISRRNICLRITMKERLKITLNSNWESWKWMNMRISYLNC
jgi:hypothetical protein